MFSIRPGKVTCAGIVVIFMVLPNSIWKGPDARVTRLPEPKVERMKSGSDKPRVDFRKSRAEPPSVP